MLLDLEVVQVVQVVWEVDLDLKWVVDLVDLVELVLALVELEQEELVLRELVKEELAQEELEQVLEYKLYNC